MTNIINTTASVMEISMILGIVLWVAAFILFIIAIIDIGRREFKDPAIKLVWIACTLLLPIIGPIIYFAAGHPTGAVRVAGRPTK